MAKAFEYKDEFDLEGFEQQAVLGGLIGVDTLQATRSYKLQDKVTSYKLQVTCRRCRAG